MKKSSAQRGFFLLACVLLSLTAAAKLVSATGAAEILRRPDPLLLLPHRWVLVAVAVIELGVVIVLVAARTPRAKLLTTLWLASNFLLYRGAKWAFNLPAPCPCLGSITEKLPVNPHIVEFGLKAVVAVLFLGSLALLFLEWVAKRRGASPRMRAAEPSQAIPAGK
jgi:hypothetical protein